MEEVTNQMQQVSMGTDDQNGAEPSPSVTPTENKITISGSASLDGLGTTISRSHTAAFASIKWSAWDNAAHNIEIPQHLEDNKIACQAGLLYAISSIRGARAAMPALHQIVDVPTIRFQQRLAEDFRFTRASLFLRVEEGDTILRSFYVGVLFGIEMLREFEGVTFGLTKRGWAILTNPGRVAVGENEVEEEDVPEDVQKGGWHMLLNAFESNVHKTFLVRIMEYKDQKDNADADDDDDDDNDYDYEDDDYVDYDENLYKAISEGDSGGKLEDGSQDKDQEMDENCQQETSEDNLTDETSKEKTRIRAKSKRAKKQKKQDKKARKENSTTDTNIDSMADNTATV